jgi:hypothetical protein
LEYCPTYKLENHWLSAKTGLDMSTATQQAPIAFTKKVNLSMAFLNKDSSN